MKMTVLRYDNIILTIYRSGDGIAPHIDRNLEWALRAEHRKYYFGQISMGLIVEPDTLQSLFFQIQPSVRKVDFI